MQKIFFFYIILLVSTIVIHTNECHALGKRVERKSVSIRVQLAGAPTVDLQIGTAFEVINPLTNKVVLRASRFDETIFIKDGALALGQWQTFPPHLMFVPRRAELFRLNGSLYRGTLELSVHNNRIMAVNHLSLEDYIKSVVPSEISRLWDYEALKAQAVAARTFTYYHRMVNDARLYDIPLGLQQYKGVAAENARTSWAVDVTFGQILFYNGKVFPSFFHAVCGGYTEEGQAVWPTSKDLPGVTRCSYCSNSSYFFWKSKHSRSDLLKKFNKAGFHWKSLQSVEPHQKASFYPRIRSLAIFADGEMHIVTVNRFRAIVGYNDIRSSIFTVGVTGDTFTFTGRGWGHGVGLCQYGAKTLAELHYDYQFILKFYYPQTELKRAY